MLLLSDADRTEAAASLLPDVLHMLATTHAELGKYRRAAEYFNRELEYRIKVFTTMFEPIMIIFVGAVVGFVAIALVSAMYGVLNGVEEDAVSTVVRKVA